MGVKWGKATTRNRYFNYRLQQPLIAEVLLYPIHFHPRRLDGFYRRKLLYWQCSYEFFCCPKQNSLQQLNLPWLAPINPFPLNFATNGGKLPL